VIKRALVRLITLILGGFIALLIASSVPTADAAPGAEVITTEPTTLVQEGVAAAPMISYQGRLLDPVTGQPKSDGSYTMAFRLYTVNSGGAALWSENKSVTLNKGLFSTLLGDTTALNLAHFNGQDLFLGITVGSDPEATPRQPIAHVAYALFAQSAANANQLGGQASSAFAPTAHSHDERYFSETEADNRFINTSGGELMSANSRSPLLELKQAGDANALVGTTASTTPGRAGLVGIGGAPSGTTINSAAAILGDSKDQRAVIGVSSNNNGVFGWSTNDDALVGQSIEAYGVNAFSQKDHAIYANGAVYGLYTPDKIYAGNGYNDIAEHIPAATDVAAGDVVVIDPENDERVIKSSKPNDPTIAGVISTEPAMLIGQSESPSPLALAGRVPVKVSAENGPIARGDLLTSSSTPGHAMKATPTLINGIPFYLPGTIIGKALGELEAGTGSLLVLIMPQ